MVIYWLINFFFTIHTCTVKLFCLIDKKNYTLNTNISLNVVTSM